MPECWNVVATEIVIGKAPARQVRVVDVVGLEELLLRAGIVTIGFEPQSQLNVRLGIERVEPPDRTGQGAYSIPNRPARGE